MNKIENIKYSGFDECVLDIYLPDCDTFDTFIYFHGGGLEEGDKNDACVLAEYLSKNEISVVSANYRMYPKAKYPEYIEDAASCVSWVFSNIEKYGKNKNIFLGGSSAGAYISMLLCFNKEFLGKYDINTTDIKGYIHDAGQPTCHFNVLRERGLDARRVVIDEFAPLYYVGLEENYSKMLFIVSDNDMENRLEQVNLIKSTLKHFGYDADLMLMHGEHCEYISKKDEFGKSVLGKIIFDYIKKWKEK